MPFDYTEELVNNDSKIKHDVESLARIILSEIEFIIKIIEDTSDGRLARILLESAVTKTAAVFQLALKACDYLDNPSYKREIIEKNKKSSEGDLSIICRLRDNHFHDGSGVIESEVFYPFARIKGRGCVGIHVFEGAKLEINGVHKFSAISCEYAITSEGIFLITNRGTELENWEHLNVIFSGVAFNAEPVLLAIRGAIRELLRIWSDLFKMRINGDGNCEYSYLNQGGLVEIFEKRNGNLYTYTLAGLKVRGDLTFTPPDAVHTKDGKVIYSLSVDKSS
jgi:hypothetical protein